MAPMPLLFGLDLAMSTCVKNKKMIENDRKYFFADLKTPIRLQYLVVSSLFK